MRVRRYSWLFAAGLLATDLLNSAAPNEPPPIRFREVAAQAGISFVLENNPTDRRHVIESMPGGIAILDYDGDARPDIYFTNGAEVPSLEKSSPKYWNRLYRNEGGLRFRDVTEEAAVAGVGYSMGAAAADYDNDGRRRPVCGRSESQSSVPQSGEWAIRGCECQSGDQERRMGSRRGLVRL
jgi:hypothetical protein